MLLPKNPLPSWPSGTAFSPLEVRGSGTHSFSEGFWEDMTVRDFQLQYEVRFGAVRCDSCGLRSYPFQVGARKDASVLAARGLLSDWGNICDDVRVALTLSEVHRS